MRRFIEKNMEAFDVVVFVVEPIDEVREVLLFFEHQLKFFQKSPTKEYTE